MQAFQNHDKIYPTIGVGKAEIYYKVKFLLLQYKLDRAILYQGN